MLSRTLARLAAIVAIVFAVAVWVGFPDSVDAIALKVSVVGDPTLVPAGQLLEVRYSGFASQEIVRVELVDLDYPQSKRHTVIGSGPIGYAMVEVRSIAPAVRATIQVSSVSNPQYGAAYLPYAFAIAAAPASK